MRVLGDQQEHPDYAKGPSFLYNLDAFYTKGANFPAKEGPLLHARLLHNCYNFVLKLSQDRRKTFNIRPYPIASKLGSIYAGS